MNKTVFVGLSGGVDSSVAALRLKRAGYNVVGVFIKVWHPDFLVCNWEEERLDAMRIAAHLDIPFLTCDAEQAYRTEVADYFIDAYKKGLTPNPDVMCNQSVKFGTFFRFAREHGASYIATGHYARRKEEAGVFRLLRGVDNNKDQTYFLWTLTQDTLRHTLFPVGDTRKGKIRNEADASAIPVASKKDSQGICFLGQIDIPEFISHYETPKTGPVLDLTGNVVGKHKGALVYTLGQRHGFTITNQTSEREPQYVVDRDLIKNTITVAPAPVQVSASERVMLSNTNWISNPPEKDEEYEAQFRYRQQPFRVRASEVDSSSMTLTVASGIDKPAEGQSCVLYRGDECLGGGIITT